MCERRKRWAPDPVETIAHTASRRTGPRAWLRALERAVDAGLLPAFNDTTQAIITVIASRMNYDTGHARYVLRDIMERTGLGRTAVTEHVKMLRAEGWLAWVEHGSLRNALRALGVAGYARTATVYAATIPPLYDAHEGHILIGTGYEARIVIDYRPDSPVDTAGKAPVENPPVDNSRTPSRWVLKGEGQVQVVGGKGVSTGRARAAEKSPRRKKKLTITGYKITGERIDRARQAAVSVRPLVNWIQGATHDQLSWVFLDFAAREWSDARIVAWLGKLGNELGVRRWRPRFPHRVIAAALRRDDQTATERAYTEGPDDEPYVRPVAPNEAFQAAREAIRGGHEEPSECWAIGEHDKVELDLLERAAHVEMARETPGLILAQYRFLGRESAIRTFGTMAARVIDDYLEMARAGFAPAI
ncbi:hypothetical protein ACFVY4_26865 [Streptomyces sp. NPDC058299]|uniref:hypothetical protein n=1 Tax=Streptomyces sp. NPDC058299 TaxID=3346435 RepID=UPI0036ECDB73